MTGSGALHLAAEKALVGVIEMMLEAGADVSAVYKGKRPLQCFDNLCLERTERLDAFVKPGSSRGSECVYASLQSSLVAFKENEIRVRQLLTPKI